MRRFEPIEQDKLEIELLTHKGVTETATLTLIDISSVPPFDSRCKIKLKSESISTEAVGFCYFSAFQAIRMELDSLKLSPQVYAAVENCYPSGMASDMGAGLKIYKLKLGIAAAIEDLVPAFSKNEFGNIVSVSTQRAFYEK